LWWWAGKVNGRRLLVVTVSVTLVLGELINWWLLVLTSNCYCISDYPVVLLTVVLLIRLNCCWLLCDDIGCCCYYQWWWVIDVDCVGDSVMCHWRWRTVVLIVVLIVYRGRTLLLKPNCVVWRLVGELTVGVSIELIVPNCAIVVLCC